MSIFICMLLITSTLILINPEHSQVKASPDEDEGSIPGFPYDYIWNRTVELANIIYEYPDNLIPKGRSFGSWGGNYTLNHTLLPKMNALGLEDVHTLRIGHIDGSDLEYSTVLEAVNYSLTVNNDNYPYNNTIEYEEFFPFPSAYPYFESDYNYTYNFSECVIWPRNMTKYWPLAGTLTNHSMNISNYSSANEYSFIVGNASFIENNDSIQPSSEQYGQVYIFDEINGSQSKIDNITDATGVILINVTKGVYSVNTSNKEYPIIRINDSDGDSIKELLDNYTTVFVDDVSGNLIFTYNFTDCNWLCPSEDFVIIDRIPDHSELKNCSDAFIQHLAAEEFFDFFFLDNQPNIIHYLYCYAIKTVAWYELNRIRGLLGLSQCKAFILYDSFNHHFMMPTQVRWDSPGPFLGTTPAIITFTLNHSTGDFLVCNSSTTTLSGLLEQKIFRQTESTPGIQAYNVIGNLTLNGEPPDPNDEIAVISNRYDGMWGQTPGDSGVGGAIVLGIAKYFKDHNITPKYNLSFIFTTGEEYGLRGAYHYSDSHPNDNIVFWFVLDQLAFDQSDTVQEASINNDEYKKVIWEIANETRYKERTGYQIKTEGEPIGGTEQKVFAEKYGCTAACISKGYYWYWDRYHRTGNNYTEGDSLNYTDRNDINVTAEYALNISKYFLIDPHCWFTDVNYQVIDSPDDADTLNDSIVVNCTIDTILPQDYVMLRAKLMEYPSGDSIHTEFFNYTITSSGAQKEFTIPLPYNQTDGEYRLQLYLYNSTNRINRIVGITPDSHNDTDLSDIVQLYHPFGCYEVFDYEYEGNLNNRIAGAVFMIQHSAVADNITAYIEERPPVQALSEFKCMIYRADNQSLVGATEAKIPNVYYDPRWVTFNFSDPKPILTQGTEYILTCWSCYTGTALYSTEISDPLGRYDFETYDGDPPGVPPNPGNFTNQSRMYSIYCNYTIDETPPEIANVTAAPDPVGFGDNVTITAEVTADYGIDSVKINITSPGLTTGYGYTNMTLVGNDTYEYVFSDTWERRQYNYTIWAQDVLNNSNISLGHSFNVSATATISICTVEDSYGANEDINITDPPNPPEGNWTIEGDSVYLNNEDAYLSVTPHTITSDGWVEVELESKQYSGAIDFLFGFNTAEARPTNLQLWKNYTHDLKAWHWVEKEEEITFCGVTGYEALGMEHYGDYGVEYGNENNTYLYRLEFNEGEHSLIIAFNDYEINGDCITMTYRDDVYEAYQYQETFWDWQGFQGDIDVLHHEYQGYDTWYRVSANLQEDVRYKARAWIDVPFRGLTSAKGKYWFGIKPHGESMQEAIANHHFYYLDPWWNASWNHYQKVTVNASFVDADLPEFPVLVVVNATIGAASDGGDSIRFVATDNVTELPYEIESWNASSGSYVWVKVDLSSTEDTSFYLYYNNSNATDGQNGTGVWDDHYLGVWHMNEQAQGARSIKDSTWTRNGTPGGNPTYEQTGKVGYGVYLDGESWNEDYFTITHDAYKFANQSVTLEGWWKIDENRNEYETMLYFGDADWYPDLWAAKHRSGLQDGRLFQTRYQSVTDGAVAIGDEPGADLVGQWIYQAGVVNYQANNLSLYKNATRQNDGGTCEPYNVSNGSSFMARIGYSCGSDEALKGYLDEVRVSDVARNSSWLNATFHTTNQSDGFLNIGEELSFLQSKITNTGSTNISGYLLIQVQYYNDTQEDWVVDNDTINETTPRTINVSEQLALDLIFNGLVNTDDLVNGNGAYRIYAAFRDPYNNILQCDDETYLAAWHEFEASLT